MEEIFKIVAFCIVSVCLILVIREQRSEIALLLTIFTSVSLLLIIVYKLEGVYQLLSTLIEKSGINKDFLAIIMKITIIAYVVEFGKNICQYASQSAIATKLEMAGKVIIVVLSLPVMTSLVNILVGLI